LSSYQIKPSSIYLILSKKISGCIPITTAPVAFDADIARFKFSFFLNIFSGYLVFKALKSTRSGLILCIRRAKRIPSSNLSKILSVSGSSGK
jgi:hypothetical protein